jgi:hypothetical protein
MNFEFALPEPVHRYFDALYQHLASAQVVPGRIVRFADGTSPVANQCHDNADRWSREHPEDAAVRGWAIMSSLAHIQYLAAHSVVGSRQNGLFDITLPPDRALRFIPHEGTEEEFTAFRTRYSNISWPPVGDS